VPNDFYAKTYQELESLKLFVRRVFITSDLGKVRFSFTTLPLPFSLPFLPSHTFPSPLLRDLF
jgi:hypothetical protein